MRRLFLPLTLLMITLGVIVACTQDPFGRSASELRREEASCKSDGGTWTMAGLSGAHQCIRPTPDAGKACTKASDCSGICLVKDDAATGGTCSPVTPLFGCHTYLEPSGEVVSICID